MGVWIRPSIPIVTAKKRRLQIEAAVENRTFQVRWFAREPEKKNYEIASFFSSGSRPKKTKKTNKKRTVDFIAAQKGQTR